MYNIFSINNKYDQLFGTNESESLIWFSITVAIYLLRPVAMTYLGIKKKSGVAVVDPELNYILIRYYSFYTIYPPSVADKIFGTAGLLVGVGAVPWTLEAHGVPWQLQDDG